MYANGGLGIDIAIDGVLGVTPNDTGDLDNGPNNELNIPVLTQATVNDRLRHGLRQLHDRGLHRGRWIGRHGEGRTLRWYGYRELAPEHSLSPISGVTQGQYVTATATDAAGNTSEFSQNLIVGGRHPTTAVRYTDPRNDSV